MVPLFEIGNERLVLALLSNYIIFMSYQFFTYFCPKSVIGFIQKEPNNKLIFMQLTSFHNFIVLLLCYLYCVQFHRIYIVFQLKVSRLENSTKNLSAQFCNIKTFS